MDYDKLLLKIGEFGRWQRKSLLYLLVPIFVAGIVNQVIPFTVLMPETVSCNIRCQKFVTPSGKPITKREAFSALNPLGNNSTDFFAKPKFCTVVKFTRIDNVTCTIENSVVPKETYVCDESSDYFWDRESFLMKSTVITDNMAFCMKGVNEYKDICTTFHFIGILLGFPFFKIVADKFVKS